MAGRLFRFQKWFPWASIGWLGVGWILGASIGCTPSDDPSGAVRLRMAHVYEVHAPTHRFGTALLNEQLEQAGSDLRVSIYPAAQLGNEEELLEQLVAGELDLAIAGPSFLAMWHSPLGVFDAAYAFRDMDHMLEVAGSPMMAEHWLQLRSKYGVRVLDTWAYGTRHITSKKPIRHPEDLSGFRLRLPGARIWQASGEALGASPLPIAFGEVYLALQQGIADGQENPVPVIEAMGFHEVQTHLNLTGHNQSSIQVLVNDRVWNRLTKDQQQQLQTVIADLGERVYQGTMAEEQRLLESWSREGTVTVVRDVDVEAFRSRALKYFSSGFGFSDLYRRIFSAEAAGNPEAHP
jgi:TRAP-type transport system periplasmic protein